MHENEQASSAVYLSGCSCRPLKLTEVLQMGAVKADQKLTIVAGIHGFLPKAAA